MKVLLTCASLLPQYGGPARSVSKLAETLADAGVDVSIWAADGSAMNTPFVRAAATLRRLSGGVASLIDQLGKPDILHDNGIWWAHNHRLARLAIDQSIPRVVSTRGALEPWARNHKSLKKSVAWWLYQRHDLQKARSHHATSAAEAHNLSCFGLRVPICVIPIGVDIPKQVWKEASATSSARVERKKIALFLGRIYPVKGLPMLVKAWARVRPEGWELHIAGPDEAGHRRNVEKEIATAELGQEIAFLGPLEGEAKEEAFRDACLFVLPSHSENFGIVVAEALAHAVPVLTTNSTPWSALLEHRCGWCVSTSVEGLAEGLKAATSLDARVLQSMGANGRNWVQNEFGWHGVGQQFIRLYEDILRIRRDPSCMSG